jgi:hypothetical protein
MSTTEIIAPARREWQISAGQSIALGVLFGLLLALAAQGTVPAGTVEDWHGNVAASAGR